MPIFQKILLYIPTVPLGIMVVVGTVLFSLLGLMLVRRLIPHQVLKAHGELTAAIFGAIAMAYTVLIAFVVVVSWQNFDRTTSHIQSEANSLVDLHRSAIAFPEPVKETIHANVEKYADAVMDEEWVLLSRGQESMKARDILRNIWANYAAFEPTTEREKAFFSESLAKLEILREARRLRIIESRTGVHPVLWFIMIAGGLITISFTFFFGPYDFRIHVAMISFLAVLIALILFTVLLFDYPFTGSVSIKPDIYRQITNF